MQQRQLRLGDILDDYCPRERRVTNHAIVAMIGEDVKQTRCTTCDAEHEYKRAKVPRQRRRLETPAAPQSQVLAGGPKRVGPEPAPETDAVGMVAASDNMVEGGEPEPVADETKRAADEDPVGASANESLPHDDEESSELGKGPVHRPLIRATLPRTDGQPPPRPAPEFTIRQPGGRQNRFRPHHPHGAQPFHGQRSSGNTTDGFSRSGMPRQGGGRAPVGPRLARRQGPGRKRSK